MRRFIFLLAAIVSIGLLGTGDGLLTESQRAEAQTTTRPNFVFVMTDDLDERSMQDLPGIRQLMGGTNGTTFENAHVTYSLCCPSRATILRGQYAHYGASMLTTTASSATPRRKAASRNLGSSVGTSQP